MTIKDYVCKFWRRRGTVEPSWSKSQRQPFVGQALITSSILKDRGGEKPPKSYVRAAPEVQRSFHISIFGSRKLSASKKRAKKPPKNRPEKRILKEAEDRLRRLLMGMVSPTIISISRENPATQRNQHQAKGALLKSHTKRMSSMHDLRLRLNRGKIHRHCNDLPRILSSIVNFPVSDNLYCLDLSNWHAHKTHVRFAEATNQKFPHCLL